jgi:hypothetical protein
MSIHSTAGFMGGLLALGAYTDPNGQDSPRAQRDLKTGRVRFLVVRDNSFVFD